MSLSACRTNAKFLEWAYQPNATSFLEFPPHPFLTLLFSGIFAILILYIVALLTSKTLQKVNTKAAKDFYPFFSLKTIVSEINKRVQDIFVKGITNSWINFFYWAFLWFVNLKNTFYCFRHKIKMNK